MIFEDKLRDLMREEGFIQTENKEDGMIFHQIHGNKIVVINFSTFNKR